MFFDGFLKSLCLGKAIAQVKFGKDKSLVTGFQSGCLGMAFSEWNIISILFYFLLRTGRTQTPTFKIFVLVVWRLQKPLSVFYVFSKLDIFQKYIFEKIFSESTI
jgi:hypothetical protein